MSEGSHAVGYADSLVGYFTAEEALRRGAEAVAKYRAAGLISFPEDREPKKVEQEPEDAETEAYNEWRREQAI